MSLELHWNQIYKSKTEAQLPWQQSAPEESLTLISKSGIGKEEAIMDMGSGASPLVDHLLEKNYQDITLLDLAPSALKQIQTRLGEKANQVCFLQGDALGFLPSRQYSLWHDRALFHFLIQEEDQTLYLQNLKASLRPGGYFLFGSFSTTGPVKCSGLPIRQYDAKIAEQTLGPDFKLIETLKSVHRTPSGMEQNYNYFLFQFNP